ncbi:branched-chain amino acid ABC transporter permease [Noviherbaspirillum sedimenti]|nr:branched-chain amino acid ABC transporter permease [Noviherbaspirillum sedimenti]
MTNSNSKLRAFSTPLLWSLSLGLIVLVAEFSGDRGFSISTTEMLIRLIAVVGIYTFIGNSGIVSFGHVGFMCLGAYAAAWAGCDPEWKEIMLTDLPEILRSHSYDLWVSLTFATILSAAVAMLLGLGLMRLSGIAATIATFGFLMILNSVFANWDALTAGTSSIIGIPTSVTVGKVWLAAVVVIAGAWWFQNSRTGVLLQATRESEPAAQSIGIELTRVRLAGFVLSAAICGFAGALYAHFTGFLSPDSMYLDTTFILLAMLVIGGMQSLSGAILGAILVSWLIELLHLGEAGFSIGANAIRLPAGSQQLALAFVLGAILLIRPHGLMGRKEWTISLKNRRREAQLPSKEVSLNI